MSVTSDQHSESAERVREALMGATFASTQPARHEAIAALDSLVEQLEAAAQLLRYPASADGPGDKFVQDCRAWLDAYGGTPNPASGVGTSDDRPGTSDYGLAPESSPASERLREHGRGLLADLEAHNQDTRSN